MLDSSYFFCNDTATTEIYTLSLHDALPILRYSSHFTGPDTDGRTDGRRCRCLCSRVTCSAASIPTRDLLSWRSEEHTSELQSRQYLVCRLLLEKKKYYQMHALYRSMAQVNI